MLQSTIQSNSNKIHEPQADLEFAMNPIFFFAHFNRINIWSKDDLKNQILESKIK